MVGAEEVQFLVPSPKKERKTLTNIIVFNNLIDVRKKKNIIIITEQNIDIESVSNRAKKNAHIFKDMFRKEKQNVEKYYHNR